MIFSGLDVTVVAIRYLLGIILFAQECKKHQVAVPEFSPEPNRFLSCFTAAVAVGH